MPFKKGSRQDSTFPPLLRQGTLDEGLLDSLARSSGQEFLERLVFSIRRVLDVRFVFVGEFCGDQWERVRVLAIAGREETVEPFEYSLAGSPCENVSGGELRIFPRRLHELFPAHAPLRGYGLKSYIGMPLDDPAGRPLGLLVVMDDAEFADLGQLETTRRGEVLRSFRTRIASEIEHRRAIEELRTIVEGAGEMTSEEIFRSLVRNLAHALHVKAAFVGEHLDEDAGFFRVTALCSDGELRTDLEGVDVPFQGGPCRKLLETGQVFVPRGLGEEFVDHALIRELGAEAYLGLALREGKEGRRLGHLALLHDRSLSERILRQPILKVFAARAGAELGRRRADRRRLLVERQLLETQKMESLGVLAGGIAHDFNNLFAGIKGFTHLAIDAAEEGSAVRTYLEEADRSLTSAAELARQLLAYSGRGHFVVRTADLGVLVRDMEHLLQAAIPKKVRLRLEISDESSFARVDHAQIRQVLMNLVTNAAEAIGEDSGVVIVRTGVLNLAPSDIEEAAPGHEAHPGPYVLLEVEDTGCGLDAGTREKMFDPFFSTKFTGRGLGLAAVQGIVHGHEGALIVRSTVGEGSVIRLLLPASAEEPDAPAAVIPIGSDWRGEGLVLLVDDEEGVRSSSSAMLERIGFDVIMARDGGEAVRIFEKRRDAIHWVLLDLTMPVMGGDEVFAALSALEPGVRVVLMSGFSRQELREKFADRGIVGFLQKPFSLQELWTVARAAAGTAVPLS